MPSPSRRTCPGRGLAGRVCRGQAVRGATGKQAGRGKDQAAPRGVARVLATASRPRGIGTGPGPWERGPPHHRRGGPSGPAGAGRGAPGRVGRAALRADLEPAGCGSTESRCLLSVQPPPGSHLPTGPEYTPPRPQRLDLAPSACAPCRCAARAQEQERYAWKVSRSDVLWWTRQNLLARALSLSTATRPATMGKTSRSVAGRHGCARTLHAHRSGVSPAHDHSFGVMCTRRPPTTVRRHLGRSRPGLTSGSPGVPDRGSVDQPAMRSSGTWTTRSPTAHTA